MQNEDATATSTSEPEAKPKARKPHKRRTPPLDSCVRTDLMSLAPNAGKAEALERLFLHYRSASAEIAAQLWQAELDGEDAPGWRMVSAGNPFHSSSLLMQPAMRQAQGSLASHLGWLGKDVGKLIGRLQRKLEFRAGKMPGADKAAHLTKVDTLVHELRAINARQAWNWRIERQSEKVMKAGKELLPASARAYESAAFLFGLAAKRRSPPDASSCQVELNRGGARLNADRIEIPEAALAELGLSLEASANASATHPYWLRFYVGDSSPDLLAKFKTSILVPALPHHAFALRNSGRATRGMGAAGPNGFPVHPVAKHDQSRRPKREQRRAKAFKANRLNPAKVRPQAVESVMLIRRVEAGGKPTYQAAIRTQMAESFKASKAAYAPLCDQVSIDFGISNLATLSGEMHGARRHGTDFLRGVVEPVLGKAVAIEAARQTHRAALVRNAATESAWGRIAASDDPALPMLACDPFEWEKLHAAALPEALHAGFEIATKRSKALRTRAEGMVETFLGKFFNDIATILRPRAIVVERLDFRDGGLSRELNRLIAHAGRKFFERKLKDLHEKFGIEIIRVESHYTSQECFECGWIEDANRKGDKFHCVSCNHQAHADENASDTVGGRRPLPGSQRLTKAREGFSWEPQGQLPWLPWEEHALLRTQGVRFPRIFSALMARPPKIQKHRHQAIIPAAGSAGHA